MPCTCRVLAMEAEDAGSMLRCASELPKPVRFRMTARAKCLATHLIALCACGCVRLPCIYEHLHCRSGHCWWDVHVALETIQRSNVSCALAADAGQRSASSSGCR